MNDVSHHSPNLEVIVHRNRNTGVVWIFWLKFKTLLSLDQALEREFTVEGGDHDLPIWLFLRAIHDQQVPIMNSSTHHRVPTGPDKENIVGIRYEVLVQVEVAIVVVLDWTGKARRDLRLKQQSLVFFPERRLYGKNKSERKWVHVHGFYFDYVISSFWTFSLSG